MPIRKPEARSTGENTFVVQMESRDKQLESIADIFASYFSAQIDLPPEIERRYLGYCETLRIIAQEIRTEPDKAIIAGRIYGMLKDVSATGGFGKSNTYVPAYVHNQVLEILEDKYAHLNVFQREAIMGMAAKIRSAGDGDNKENYYRVRGELSKQTIEQILNDCQVDNLRERLDFDPETGEAWED